MSRVWGAVLCMAMAFGAGETAWAAPLTGSVSDPQDDVPFDINGKRLPDVRSVYASYDNAAGVLILKAELWKALDPPRDITNRDGTTTEVARSIEISATLNAAGAEGCNDPERRDIDVNAFAFEVVSFSDQGARLSYRPSSGVTGVHYGPMHTGGDWKVFTARFSEEWRDQDPSDAWKLLIGRNIRCVTNISVGGDELAAFCLGGCPPVPPPPIDKTPPRVSWVTPTTGQTISGILSEQRNNCRADAPDDGSGMAYTENYVDGKLNDKQTSAPWSCELDTRTLPDGPHTLKVRAYDKAGNFAEASAHVTVKNQGAPPVAVVIPQLPPPVVQQSLPVVQQPLPVVHPPPVVLRSPSPEATRRVTTSQAKRQVKTALAKEYRSFRQRDRYTVRCRANRAQTVQTCVVRWTAGRGVHAGRIRVSRKASGYRVSMSVRRTR